MSTPADVIILEVLDAAGSRLRSGRVEATALVLSGEGVLKPANLEVVPANGARAHSDQLIDALFEAVDQGRIRRYAEDWQLTPDGIAVLDQAGARAGEAARHLADKLNALDDDALADEADRLSRSLAAA
ncbi:MAG: hypothetical protein ACLPUT_14695 [Solirubrobacteraceae bacterium]